MVVLVVVVVVVVTLASLLLMALSLSLSPARRLTSTLTGRACCSLPLELRLDAAQRKFDTEVAAPLLCVLQV